MSIGTIWNWPYSKCCSLKACVFVSTTLNLVYTVANILYTGHVVLFMKPDPKIEIIGDNCKEFGPYCVSTPGCHDPYQCYDLFFHIWYYTILGRWLVIDFPQLVLDIIVFVGVRYKVTRFLRAYWVAFVIRVLLYVLALLMAISYWTKLTAHIANIVGVGASISSLSLQVPIIPAVIVAFAFFMDTYTALLIRAYCIQMRERKRISGEEADALNR